MPKYVYEGPVLEFEHLLTDKWRAETLAPTKRKAISNLQYQFKKNIIDYQTQRLLFRVSFVWLVKEDINGY